MSTQADLFSSDELDVTIEYPDGRIVRGKMLIQGVTYIEPGLGPIGEWGLDLIGTGKPSVYTVKTES